MGEKPERSAAETSGAAGKKARIYDRPQGWGRNRWLIVAAVVVVIAILIALVLAGRP